MEVTMLDIPKGSHDNLNLLYEEDEDLGADMSEISIELKSI